MFRSRDTILPPRPPKPAQIIVLQPLEAPKKAVSPTYEAALKLLPKSPPRVALAPRVEVQPQAFQQPIISPPRRARPAAARALFFGLPPPPASAPRSPPRGVLPLPAAGLPKAAQQALPKSPPRAGVLPLPPRAPPKIAQSPIILPLPKSPLRAGALPLPKSPPRAAAVLPLPPKTPAAGGLVKPPFDLPLPLPGMSPQKILRSPPRPGMLQTSPIKGSPVRAPIRGSPQAKGWKNLPQIPGL